MRPPADGDVALRQPRPQSRQDAEIRRDVRPSADALPSRFFGACRRRMPEGWGRAQGGSAASERSSSDGGASLGRVSAFAVGYMKRKSPLPVDGGDEVVRVQASAGGGRVDPDARDLR